MFKDKKAFQAIADLVALKVPNVVSIKLDRFKIKGAQFEFIIVDYGNGIIKARNVHMNSLTVNIKELGMLLATSYYEEVMSYEELKAEYKAETAAEQNQNPINHL